MKKTVAIMSMTATCVAVLTLTSCSSTPPPTPVANAVDSSSSTPTTAAPSQSAASGIINIEASWADVTIESIDYSARRAILRRSDGALFDCKVGPDAVNFDKLKVGDDVRITLAEECVTLISRGSEKPRPQEAALVRVVVDGVPSGMAVNTTDLQAKVLDVDDEARRIIVEIEKGEARSLRVARGVDLADLHPGDKIWVQVSEALAVNVER